MAKEMKNIFRGNCYPVAYMDLLAFKAHYEQNLDPPSVAWQEEMCTSKMYFATVKLFAWHTMLVFSGLC
jgi:hypothetical protein